MSVDQFTIIFDSKGGIPRVKVNYVLMIYVSR